MRFKILKIIFHQFLHYFIYKYLVIIIGILFFNEYLNLIALIGAFLIVLSGILSLQAQKKQLNAL